MRVLPISSFVVRNSYSAVKLFMRNEEQALATYKRLITKLVKKYAASTRVEKEDLKQEASIALLVALRSWQPEGGRSIESWVHKHIENALIKLAEKSNQENRHRTDPPPPSGREGCRHDPADPMDLLKSAEESPEEQLSGAEFKRVGLRLLAILSPEDRAFLLSVKELGTDGYVRKQESLSSEDEVPPHKRMRVSRRAKKLEEKLVDAAKKWSA